MSKLLDLLVSTQNKSGSIPSAPVSLQTLKSGILGVPFDVNTPGMSGLLSLQNLVPGLVQAIQSLGSIQAVGNFGQILSRSLGELSGTGLSPTDAVKLANALQRATSGGELQQVVGPIQALGAALITSSGGAAASPTYNFPAGPGGSGGGVAAGDLQISGNVIWHNIVNPWVQKAGDTMTGTLTTQSIVAQANVNLVNGGLFVDRTDSNISFIEMSNQVAAGGIKIGTSGFTNIFFDNRYGFTIAADTYADIQAGMAGGNSLFQISNTGVVSASNVIVGNASNANSPPFRLPHGTAPSPTTNGDLWTTSTAFQVSLSGATKTMALLENNNNWSGGVQVFTNATSYQPQFYLMNQANDISSGYYLFRKSRGPTTGVNVGDSLGTVEWQGMTSNGGVVAASYMTSTVTAVNNAAVDATISFLTSQSGGSLGQRGAFGLGFYLAGVADMGSGTMNATGYYKNGVALPFTAAFESAQQTITAAGSLTLAHSLGVKPKLYQAYIVCQTAEGGYSVGDECIVDPGWTADASIGRGLSIVPDATNLNIRFGNNSQNFIVVNKSTGANFNITNANWKLVVRAWA